MFIYYGLLLFLILGISIFIFHRKTYLYNKEQELSPIGTKKDIWPYRLLRILWFLFILFSILFLLNPLKFPKINLSNNIITKNNESKGNDSKKNLQPVYRQIIDAERQLELSGNKKVVINPVISGYYELITDNKRFIQSGGISDGVYPVPKPINISYCKTEDKYWNLGVENGLNYNGFIYEYLNANKKKDVVIGILDTGITKKNGKLAAHLIGSGRNVVNQSVDTVDILGHGSHVAGIILQTFPNARILPIKVSEDYSENVTETDIIAGLRYAIDQNVDIINMSFGGLGKDFVTNQLINEAVSKGIIVIAAAGNESQDVTLYYPANYFGVMSVGSVGKLGKSDFSNYGADVDMPGECIYSTTSGGNMIFMDGTSMSAPHLAGVIGSYLSLDNKISQESGIIKLINENLQDGEGKSILNMSKLLNIENQNQKVFETFRNIKSTLDDIENNLISLQGNLTEKGLNNTINYIDKTKSSLEKNAKDIEDIYKSLDINEGFGIGLTKKVDDYINTLKNLLNKDSVQLISKDSMLGLSLGTESCYETYNKCTYEEKQIGCDDTSYPGYICGNFDIIITGGIKLPSKGSDTYSTMRDYQESFTFPVYQGEKKFVGGNKYIGEVKLSGIPKRLAGQSSATVYFEIDKYGYLSVKAVDDSNGSNVAVKTKLTPATNSVENKGDDYDKILTNISYALNETKDFIGAINDFYNVDPRDYISEITSGALDRIEHIVDENITGEIINIEGSTIQNNIISNENIKVDSVIDGDTIRVFMNGKSVKVRLIGVDAPESTDTRYGYTECFGNESTNYLKNLLSNKTIGLEYDLTQGMYDKYDRVLAYVFLNGENINKKIIEDGYGREYTYNLPYKYQKEFKSAQRNAESLNKGLWNMNTCEGDRKPNY